MDFSESEESHFVGAFSDGPWAKSEPILSMSGFQKPAAGAVLGTSVTWITCNFEIKNVLQITPQIGHYMMLALIRHMPHPLT